MLVDTNRRTTHHLACLRSNGVKGVLRYYARTTKQPEKRLTRSEAEAILGAGLAIGVVSQGAGNKAVYFNHGTGLQDGAYARNYAASVIGQPEGSAIYFAVDYNADADHFQGRVIPYLRGVAEALAPSPHLPEYRIGVYGNGLVCAGALDAGLAELAWLSQSTAHHGHGAFKKSKRWTLFQHPTSTLCGIGIDRDDVRPGVADFGGFDRLDDPDAALDLLDEDLAGLPGIAAAAAFDGQAFSDWCGTQNFRHFKPYELLVLGASHGNPQSPCHGLNAYPPPDLWANVAPTVRVLDTLRERLNAPIRVLSAYRSSPYNACIGGAGHSAHKAFQAIDFIADGNSRPVDWARVLRAMRDDEHLFRGGVGLYASFVHVDTNGTNRDW